MNNGLSFISILLLLSHFSVAAHPPKGGARNQQNDCSQSLEKSLSPNRINIILDDLRFSEKKKKNENANPLWFLDNEPDPSKMPSEQVLIKAIHLHTQHGVGSTLFYPFGGIDVVTGANNPSVHTIYSVQLEPFGDIDLGLRMLGQASSAKKIIDLSKEFFDAIALGWISSGTLQRASELTRGLGLFSLLVIRKLMGANILNVGYLDFNSGVWTERTLTDPPAVINHGFVEFEYQGRIIKYFLIQANLSDAAAKESGSIGANELGILLKGRHYDSILRHIHRAQQRLKSDFSQLLNLVNESERIFSTGPEEEPYTSYPTYDVVFEQDRVSNWAPYFGIYGPMAILLKNPEKK